MKPWTRTTTDWLDVVGNHDRSRTAGELLLGRDCCSGGMIDRRPSLIVQCVGAADVVQAVRFAREGDMVVSVRGGGHGVAGAAVCDGGLMIDLSQMRGVWVDPNEKTARAQAGALWGDFDAETGEYGLHTTGGIVTHTGIAGLTLGGGIGWLMRKHGLTIDNVLSFNLVTAEGEAVRANAEENPDLFWGLRGGGGNFCVVTSFEYRLHEVAPQVLAGVIVHPADSSHIFKTIAININKAFCIPRICEFVRFLRRIPRHRFGYRIYLMLTQWFFTYSLVNK